MNKTTKTTMQLRFQPERTTQRLTDGGWRKRVVLLLLALAFGPSLRAQTVNLGGTGALGDFINPLSVTSATGEACNYNTIQIDLAQGKVFAIPFRKLNNASCDATPVDITSQVFSTGISTFDGSAGVLEVANFTLRETTTPTNASAATEELSFVPNANNTPVWIRATGNITINSGTTLNVAGAQGAGVSGFLRGAGGAGGPGGYRGGDGGNGGLFPSAGSSGFGPGGGPGGVAGTTTCVVPVSGAKLLATGTIIAGRDLTAFSNDLLTMLRGGSGGGGAGGCTANASGGGGGGGGAIFIAANNTITVNGAVDARSGAGFGSAGVGGVIRLVAATIAGSGALEARNGRTFIGIGIASDNGIIRLEAFTISFSGSVNAGSNVLVSSSPGQVILPGSATASAFLQISKVTNGANANETVSPSLVAQDVAGRTGKINPVDVTMPDLDATPISTVTVDFLAGPNTIATPFPAGKVVTLVVTPLDPAQGASANYTGTLVCPGPGGGNCTVSITGVSLPLGFSSFSAFTVLNIDTGGALARMFPTTYAGEAIEAVRLETGEQGMEYVLIARSGREFPYRPQ